MVSALPPISAHIPYAHPKSYFESRVDVSEPEQMRIRMHLARVESDLRAHTPPGLSPAQTAARKLRLDDLHAYRVHGVFPSNRDFPDSLVPYFIDARGVACAVGYLVIASGHRDFAEFIQQTQNHAYIREIADPRLAEWAEASGLTMEECARIQPGYGLPVTYPFIQDLEVSAEGAVWTLAAPLCLCSMTFQAITLLPGGAWVNPYPQYLDQTMVCLDPQDRPLIGVKGSGGPDGLLWEGRMVSGIAGAGSNACDWSPDGSVTWIAGNSGLRSYRLFGSNLELTRQPEPRESMLMVAASRLFVWSGSNRGAFGGGVQSSNALTQLDSAGKSSFRVTGLSSHGTDGVWAGINGGHGKNLPTTASQSSKFPVFSREGLLFRRGLAGEWTAYTRANAGLPSDTIQALTPAAGQSVWIAAANGIFRFTPPNSVTQIRPAFDVPVTDLATDSLGRLYIGTWGLGVFRWEDGSTQSLGYFSTPSSLFRSKRDTESGGIPKRKGTGQEDWSELRSLLGRKAEASSRRGVLFLQPTGR